MTLGTCVCVCVCACLCLSGVYPNFCGFVVAGKTATTKAPATTSTSTKGITHNGLVLDCRAGGMVKSGIIEPEA